MALLGHQIEQLRDAVLAGFTEGELTMFLRFDLDITLANKIVMTKPYDEKVFDLIVWLNHQGEAQVSRFVETIYKLRPGKTQIVDVCAVLAPYLVPATNAGKSTQTVVTGIGAVTLLATQNGAIKLQLVNAKGPLELTAQGIATLGNLKKVHDQLHFLELRLYRELRRTARNFRDAPAGDEEEFELGSAVADLSAILRKVHQRVDKLPTWTKPGAEVWVEMMDTAHNSIVKILEQREGDPLRHVNGLLLDGLLGFSPVMHAMLFQEAARLPLAAIIKAFDDIVPAVTTAGRTADAELIAQALVGLRQIQALLRDQVAEHGFWQKISIKLHLAEKGISRLQIGNANAESDVADVMAPALNDVKAFCSFRLAESWTTDVDKSLETLNQTWETIDTNVVAVERSFQTFQKYVGERFKDVDDALLNLCDEMSGLDGPIIGLRNQL